ncbi:MAG: DUF4342 domain-containing protein [Thermosynechococcaceae cyanobacterium]
MSESSDRDSDQMPSPEIDPTDSDTTTKTSIEEFLVNANTVMVRIKALIGQGNLRQIVIKTEAGRPLLRIPCTVGVVGGTLGLMFSPFLMTAIAALGVLAGRLTLVIEKTVD